MTKDFYTALKERRTYYGINKEYQISEAAHEKRESVSR